MSRYSGPQQPGAERQARVERRQQAEVRQEAERKRGARRRAEQQAPPRVMTDDERAELIHAVNVIQMAHVLNDLRRLTGRP